jgi:DNA-binding transcriptional ArsR family regulator
MFRNMSSEQEPAAEPEPAASPAEPLQLTDAKAMRALAHPVRIALLEILGTRTLTATQASELLGESPANCAFHLRTLARYGFVEEAGGGRGRERPWRSLHKSFSVSSTELADPQARLAAEMLGRIYEERWLDRIRRVMSSAVWPAGWERMPTSNRTLDYLTVDEAIQATLELRAVFERYAERRDKPELRPAGALPVEFVMFGYPLMDQSFMPDETTPEQA